MSAHDLFLIIHLLLFCYWLGGDLGVYYSSGFVIDPKLSPPSRLVAAKIMVNLDLVPRICMALMLTVGGLLSERWLEHPTWQMAAIILLAPFWLAMVLTIHVKEGQPVAKSIARFDYWFRWVVVISIIVSVAYSFSTGRLDPAPWIGAKLLIFAGLVFCGIMIRRYIGPYAAGIHALAKGSITDPENVAMAQSLRQCRWFVYAIWVGLIVEAALGVIEPGGQEPAVVAWLSDVLAHVGTTLSGLRG